MRVYLSVELDDACCAPKLPPLSTSTRSLAAALGKIRPSIFVWTNHAHDDAKLSCSVVAFDSDEPSNRTDVMISKNCTRFTIRLGSIVDDAIGGVLSCAFGVS